MITWHLRGNRVSASRMLGVSASCRANVHLSSAAAFTVLEGLALRIDPRSSEWRLLPICATMQNGQKEKKGRRPLSTVGTRKAERRTWRGLYPMKPAICGTWSVESWNVWVLPLSANGMICLLTSSAGFSSTRSRAIARHRRVEDADRPFPARS